MADIDMIPRGYREGLRVRRTLAIYAGALAALLVLGGGASVLLRWRLALETPRLEQSRAASAQASAMRTQLIDAQARKDGLAENVEALGALRGAGEVAALAAIVDGALNEQVWFDQLRLTRTQELLQAPPSPLPPGTVQARAPQTGAVQAWRLGSQVAIAGQAQDNGAMTRFLAALAANPRLSNVRFLNSSTAPQQDGGAVSFNVAATLVKQEARQ